MAVGIVLLVVTTLALQLTGRSWRAWHLPALSVLFAWWAGVNVGRSGLGSGAGMLSTVALFILLPSPAATITAFARIRLVSKKARWVEEGLLDSIGLSTSD